MWHLKRRPVPSAVTEHSHIHLEVTQFHYSCQTAWMKESPWLAIVIRQPEHLCLNTQTVTASDRNAVTVWLAIFHPIPSIFLFEAGGADRVAHSSKFS